VEWLVILTDLAKGTVVFSGRISGSSPVLFAASKAKGPG
jgi:hypothetical protein